jgi:hypothetical protein
MSGAVYKIEHLESMTTFVWKEMMVDEGDWERVKKEIEIGLIRVKENIGYFGKLKKGRDEKKDLSRWGKGMMEKKMGEGFERIIGNWG